MQSHKLAAFIWKRKKNAPRYIIRMSFYELRTNNIANRDRRLTRNLLSCDISHFCWLLNRELWGSSELKGLIKIFTFETIISIQITTKQGNDVPWTTTVFILFLRKKNCLKFALKFCLNKSIAFFTSTKNILAATITLIRYIFCFYSCVYISICI